MAAAGIAGKPRASAQRHRRENTDDGSGTSQNADDRTTHVEPFHDAAAAMRAKVAMDLIVAGHTYEEAALQAGYSGRAACFTAVQRELRREVLPSAARMRKLELRRLDLMLKAMLPKAIAGEEWPVVRVLEIMARRAKYMGLDITRDEVMATMPYEKKIVLEDQPAIPALGEVVE